MNAIVPLLSKYSNDMLMLTYGLGGGCIGYNAMKDIKYELFGYAYGSFVGLLIPPIVQALAPKPPFKNSPTYALPFFATYYTLKHYNSEQT